jgi:histidinol-phosphate aminotransferase
MIKPRNHLQNIKRTSKETPVSALRLHRNERAEPFEPEIFAQIVETFEPEDLCFYPDENPLLERLARELDADPDMISISTGSDAAIRRTFQAFIDPGETVVYCHPSYAMYAVYAELFQAESRTIEYTDARKIPVEQYLQAIDDGPRVLIITNPDQPTGAHLRADDLETIVRAAADCGTLVLVDEAYYPFCPVTAAPLVQKYGNLLVTRTFSKIFGLAGLRVGFALGHSDLIVALDSVKGASEVSALGLKAACWLIDNADVVIEHHRDLDRGREVLQAFASEHGWAMPSCPANFQLLQPAPGIDPEGVVAALAAHGIAIRGGFKHPSVTRCLRLTLCGENTMRRVVSALEHALKEGA